MAFIDGTCKGDAVARVIIDDHSLELLRLQLQGETALSMEAAYGYNLVMFSLPGAAAKEQMHLVIEK